MIRVEVYGKPDCALCDEAHEALEALRAELPFELVKVDVTLDPAANARWAEQVPIVFVDGRKATRGAVDVQAVRKKIERALALAEGSTAGETTPIPQGTLRRVKVFFAFVVVAAVLGVFVAKAWENLAGDAGRAEREFRIEWSGVPVPDFRHFTADGKAFSTAEHRGQVLFVNFWATWCPPCRDEMPSMVRLGQELEGRHPGKFKMVAVSVDDGWEPVRQFFLSRIPAGLTITLDTDQLATRAFYCAARNGACPDAIKFPETYVVDKKGRIAAYVVGPRDWSQPAARRFLERLIND